MWKVFRHIYMVYQQKVEVIFVLFIQFHKHVYFLQFVGILLTQIQRYDLFLLLKLYFLEKLFDFVLTSFLNEEYLRKSKEYQQVPLVLNYQMLYFLAAHRRVVLVQRRELRRALELGRGDFPGLDVVVVVPNQLPERHEAEPNRHRDEARLALALALRDEVGRDVEAVHERARRALLRVADVVDGPARDVTGGARVPRFRRT